MRSVNLNRYPDADYTPNDMGEPQSSNSDWEDFEDFETSAEFISSVIF